MANLLYPKGKENLLLGDIHWDTDNIKVTAVSSTYTYDAGHDYYDDLTGVIADSANLGTKTYALGVADAADLEPAFTSVGTNIAALIVWMDTGTPSTSPLIAHLDSGTGFPHTQNGQDVDVYWNGSGIFAL